MSDQMVFKRHEIKYMLTRTQYELILEQMSPYMNADVHGKSTILSLYFDTPDFLLIRRSLDHPLYKEKIRLRSYGTATADTKVFLELKKKYNSIVYKRRLGLSLSDAIQYFDTGICPCNTQIMQEIDFAFHRYEGVRPAVLLSYDREAFYSKTDSDFRITFDQNILWRNTDLSVSSPIGGTNLLEPDQVLMEIKTKDAIPLWMVELLSHEYIYKTSFSKYGTAYRTLYTQQRFEQNKQTITEHQLNNGGIYQYA
jgi:hypothetical protein